MIFDQEKVEQGIVVPDAHKCRRFTGSMLTFKLGRLLEKAQRVYWTEKTARTNQDAMWDMPPPLIMSEEENEEEQKCLDMIQLESQLFNSPSSSCSEDNREAEFTNVKQGARIQVSEISLRKKRSTMRLVQCQTSLRLFEHNLDEAGNENTCTSDDSSNSPKAFEDEESEQWENLCAAVDNVLRKANLVEPQKFSSVQVGRPALMKKKKQKKRPSAFKEYKQKKSAVKPEKMSPTEVKPGGYTDPQIDYLFDCFSAAACESPASPEVDSVISLNTIIEKASSASRNLVAEIIRPELCSPVPEPVCPAPIFNLPRVSRGLGVSSVPSFVGSLLPSKLGIILNRAHKALAEKQKSKKVKLAEVKLPELIPISDDESPEPADSAYNSSFSGIARLCGIKECTAQSVIPLDRDKLDPENSVDTVHPQESISISNRTEEMPMNTQNIQLNDLKFDFKSIEEISSIVRSGDPVVEGPAQTVGNMTARKSHSKKKCKYQHFEVVQLDSDNVNTTVTIGCSGSTKQFPAVSVEMTEAANFKTIPLELIPLPPDQPKRTENLCSFSARQFFPLPSSSVSGLHIPHLQWVDYYNNDGIFNQKRPTGGIPMENIPKISSSLLSTKIGLVFEKAGKAHRIENERRRNAHVNFIDGHSPSALMADEEIAVDPKPAVPSNNCAADLTQERVEGVGKRVATEQLIAPKKMRLASFYGSDDNM